MPISAKGKDTQVPGHRRSRRDSSPVDSLAAEAASRRAVAQIRPALTERPGPSRRSWRSTRDSSEEDTTAASPFTQIRLALTGRPGPSQRSGRSTRNSSEEDATAASPPHPTWMILNRAGARRDYFPGDHTTSVFCHTSTGQKISVSFELVEPPGTSVLTLDWPQGPPSICPEVIAADRNLVLFRMVRGIRCPAHPVDYFIYEASSDPSRRSSLSLVPVLYPKRDSNEGRPMQHIMSTDATGVLSLNSGLFIVADLETRKDAVDIYLFVSGSGKSKGYDGWRVLKRLPVRRANGDLLDLSWWSTDRVLPYRHHLIWVNYYKGMIFGNMEDPWREPTLRYVPLPVDATKGICDDRNCGRRWPEASHNIFVTRSAIKFVTISHQYSSSSVMALNRCWSTFRITTWSLCNYSDTWIEEATLDAEEFWDLDAENQLPHVMPEFPVFNMKNPDAICFSLYEGSHTFGYSGKTWMVEVHMKKKLLLNATAYSEEQIFFRQITTKSARVLSQGLPLPFISSEMPDYLPEKRRKLTSKSTTKAVARSALPV